MKQWLISMTAVTVFSGVIYILLPNGKTKKTFSVISGIVLLYVFLSPLQSKQNADFIKSFSFSNRDFSQSLEAQYDDTVILAFKNGVKEALTKCLNEKNIETDDISVECEKKDNEYAVKKITVYVGQDIGVSKSKIIEIIQQNIQGEPEIEVIGR